MKDSFLNLIASLKNDRRLLVLLGIILLIIVVIAYSTSQKAAKPNPVEPKFTTVPDNRITVNEVQPDKDTYPTQESSKWKFLAQKRENGLNLFTYYRENEFYAQTAYGVDSQDVIKYISNMVQPYQKLELAYYEQKYGLKNPDLVKYPKEFTEYAAYIYLDRGLMLYVRFSDNKVSHEIYFTPTTAEGFLQLWGAQLVNDRITSEEYGF